jgi:dihydroneopterin aldolase
MADQITLTGIKALGFHGVLPHESVDGQEFIVDLTVTLDLAAPSLSDSLDETINYALLAQIVHDNIVGPPVKLIERLAGKIATQVRNEFKTISSVTVTVHKPHAPVALEFSDIAVTVTR